MARKPRLDVPGMLYHVISRGNNQQEIFSEQKDYRRFLQIIERVKATVSFKIYAYCLMPNHFHLLMESRRAPIARIMQRVLTSYTLYFNRAYKRNGHLFQGRYKSILCEKDSYFLELIRYIHLNPVRAGIVKTPGTWKWSGHEDYLGKRSQKLVASEDALACFSSKLNAAHQHYADFVGEGLSMGHRLEYYPPEKLPYLGENKFIEDMTVRHIELGETREPGKHSGAKVSLESLAKDVAEKDKISAVALLSKSRVKTVAQARKRFIEQSIMQGYKAVDIAHYLRCSPGYITKINK